MIWHDARMQEAAPRTDRQAIVLLADGARADEFARHLAAGDLPEIQRHIVDRGSLRTASSTFTSTTVPAHIPFLAGRFAGSANLPGYRWFDRAAQPSRRLPLGPWSFRSYNGIEASLIGRDLAADAPTLFELLPGAQNVFGAVARGVQRGNNLAPQRKKYWWLKAHFRHDYEVADRAAARLTVAALERPAPFRFVVLPGIDWCSHYIDPFGLQTAAAYRRVDEAVGAIAARLQELGRYDDTLLAVVSDHGHEPVHTHFDIALHAEADLGLRVAYHSRRQWRRAPEFIVAVSGNGMAHLYGDGPGRWAVIDRVQSWLLEQPSIDLMARREGDELLVLSRRGRARLAEQSGGLRYRVEGSDPFGYPELPEQLSHEEALAATFETDYPDGLLQLAQIFRSPRTGDLVVSATPGFDLREHGESPEHLSSHGSLHRTHMHVPLAVSRPLEPGPLRTVDAFSIVAEHLGLAEPPGVDGRSRLLPAGAPSPALA